MALRGDEGRRIAAISFGELLTKLRSGDFRMGKPNHPNDGCPRKRELTGGTETSKYPEEEKSIEILLVAVSERGRA